MQIVNPRVAPHSCSAFIGIKRQAGAGCCVAVGSRVLSRFCPQFSVLPKL